MSLCSSDGNSYLPGLVSLFPSLAILLIRMDVHPHVHSFSPCTGVSYETAASSFFRAGLTGRLLAGRIYRDLYHISAAPQGPGIMWRASHQQSGTVTRAKRASTCNNKCVHHARYQYDPDLFPDY